MVSIPPPLNLSRPTANNLSSSNMLYPKEDRINNTLMFACRTCQFSEPAASSCVFRNNLYNTTGETAGVTQDVGADPTVGLPDFSFCTLCGQEVVCPICGEEIDDSDAMSDEYEEDMGEGWDAEYSDQSIPAEEEAKQENHENEENEKEIVQSGDARS